MGKPADLNQDTDQGSNQNLARSMSPLAYCILKPQVTFCPSIAGAEAELCIAPPQLLSPVS